MVTLAKITCPQLHNVVILERRPCGELTKDTNLIAGKKEKKHRRSMKQIQAGMTNEDTKHRLLWHQGIVLIDFVWLGN